MYERGLSTIYKTNTSLGRTIGARFFKNGLLQKGRRCAFSVVQPDSAVFIPSINLQGKSAVIDGTCYPALRSRNTPVSLYYRGQYFETEEELWIAKLLRKMKIRFLHHVTFEVDLPQCKEPKIWRPDFVFERPYVWVDDHKPGTVISGIEVKHKKMNGSPQTLSDALKKQSGIRILVINRSILKPWFEAGLLPIEPLEAYGLSAC